MKAIRLTAAAALLAVATGAFASQSNPTDIAFARNGDSDSEIVVLTADKLACTGIKKAYYVLGEKGDALSVGCYYGYHDAVFGMDVQGAPHRWPLATFKRTDYALKNNVGIPMARD